MAGYLGPERKTARLIEFHSRHKLQIMAHSPAHYSQMGKLTAKAKEIPIHELFQQYEKLLMEALRLKATVKKNVNVLQHIMGYFKKVLTPEEKIELLEVIDQYSGGYLPLSYRLLFSNTTSASLDSPISRISPTWRHTLWNCS